MWISAPIQTDSHRLSEQAFALLMGPGSEIRVQDVSENAFLVSVLAPEDSSDDEPRAALGGHKAQRLFLIALNVATLGRFYWADEPWVHPIVHVSESLESERHQGTIVVRPAALDLPLADLSERDVQNAAILFGTMARHPDSSLEAEYARGLLLMRMHYFDIDFRREAFACFYRALEYFAAHRILHVKKLKNELRDLQRAIESLGMAKELLGELKGIYAVRSSQVAHAQTIPRDVTLEEIMKTKTFLDFVMFKTYKRQGVKMLEAINDAQPSEET